MSLVKGPFTVQYNDNALVDVSELTFNYDVDSNDYSTLDGRTYSVPGAVTASVEVTVLSTDIDSLSQLLPQYYVPKGGTLSTGEQVEGEEGAIDILAAQSCTEEEEGAPLTIEGCTGDITRLWNATPSLSGIEIADNAVRTVTITYTGVASILNENTQISPCGRFFVCQNLFFAII